MKYLTKFTKEDTDFLGWRLSLCRKGRQFVRYFSALEWGGMDRAESEARQIRESLLADLEANEETLPEIFERYRKTMPHLPAGMHAPCHGWERSHPKACSIKLGESASALVAEMRKRWGVDLTSIIRISLYMFIAWSRDKKQQGVVIQGLSEAMAAWADDGMPTFEEFCRYDK